jgi:uncharacterized membrane-anchored protein YitT (DUF2179 family)/predicted metal-dependent HD superfamily phosphohydrolase
MQYEKIYSILIPRLEEELPSYLTYHTVQHTKNVIAASEQLAISENVSGDDLVMLKTAALFHDSGFLQQSEGHEEISCILARDYLPDYGYNDNQIEQICRIIMATRLPQSPFDLLSRIICDADLFYLGKEGYAEYAERLFQEYKNTGVVGTDIEWQLMQIEFLSSHKYFTQSANNLLEATKQKTLQELKSGIETSIAPHKEDKWFIRVQDVILALIGVTFAGVALKLFLVPNHFFDGGVTGISLLVHEIYEFNLGLVILVLNLPLIIVSYYSVGKQFAFRTLIVVILLGVCLMLIPNYAVTADKLLISIFGGVFLGIGIGLIMRTGAALDGIEVLAVYTLKKTSFTITEIILGINIIIFTIAGFKFGIEVALYSILTYFTATRCIDYVVEGLQAYTGVTIVSGKSEAIKYQLVNKLGRGITIYKGERGFLPGKYEISTDVDIIFTVITRLELRKLKNLVYEVDPKAFVFANTIKEASGGVIKRRHTH